MSLADQYEQFYKPEPNKGSLRDLVIRGWPRNRFEAIIASVPDSNSVLDVGCGDGYLLYQLRNRFKTLIGLEYAAGRLEQARTNLADLNFVPVLGSAEDMRDVGSEAVDCVVSSDTIEHVPDVYAAAKEMFRVLRPRGTLVINTPNIAFIKKRLLLLLGRFPSTSQPNEGLGSDIFFDGGHLHYFTFRSLSLVLARAGFEVNRAIGYGRLGRLHDLYPPLLSGGVQLIATKPD